MRTFKKKKPDTINAFRLAIDIPPDWFTDHIIDVVESFQGKHSIFTKNGIQMFACTGDYVIQGSKGRFTVLKPDIFEASYEEVKES